MIKVNMLSIMRRYRWRIYVAGIGAIIVFALTIGALSFSVVRADVDGTGSGSGCSDVCTTYMSAWNLYPTASSGPMGNGGDKFVKNNDGTRTTWSQVVNRCKSYGSVWVFEVYGGSSTTVKYGKGFNYSAGAYDDTNSHNPQSYSRSNQEPVIKSGTAPSTVKVYYDALPVDQKSGYTWGKNVAWFCYDNNPPWSLTVASTANKKVAEEGETITWTHTVTNDGPNKTNKKVAWRYQNRGWSTAAGTNWTFASGSTKGTSATQTSEYTVAAADFGKQVCRSTYASPGDNKGVSTESEPACVTIAKRPKVHIIGGDLAVGTENSDKADIVTATTTKTAGGAVTTFGSWTEYAVLTNGKVTGMGSGAAYNGGSSRQLCGVNLLTFTNAGKSVCTQDSDKGNYKTNARLLTIGTAFPIESSTPKFKDLSDSSKRRVETTTGNIEITGGVIQKGDWLVINAPTATVTITGDILYTNATLNSIRDIPQLVIIANRINIKEPVSRIDAWLVATGKDGVINTCSDYAVSAPLTDRMCDKELVVNGPVAARSLYLRRTAGAGSNAAAGDPAEVFNLRPDAYLWSVARTNDTPQIQSVYTTELPPRF